MNRKFKFRIYNVKTNKWIYQTKYAVSLFGETILLGGFMDGIKLEELEDCVIQQFTGLIDKNEKEIYEGDIVKRIIHIGLGETKEESKEIKFNPYEGYGLKNGEKDLPFGWLWVVIGNIFENPELIP